MIKVRVNKADFQIETYGHAGMAEEGHDIVCAGVSALMQALLNVLIREKEDSYLQLDWYAGNPGSMRIHAKPYNWRKPIIRAYFKMTVLGLKAIEQDYGKYIKVTEEGQDDGDD